jgi:hypothetical protein
MKIDNMGNEYCEFCGQDIKSSPESQRTDLIIKTCLFAAIFFAGALFGLML